MGSTHLPVKVVLYEIPEFLLAVSLCLCSFGFLRPFGEFCRAVLVAIDAEQSIRLQPGFVLFKERFVGLGSLHLFPLLCKKFVQVVHLGCEHTLVVNLWQGVQFLTQLLEMCFLLLVLDLRQLTEVRVLRMQGINADGVVRIGVLPGMCDVRIVNGQHLQDALVGLGSPVNHQFQVSEIAYAKRPLTA